MIVLLQSVLGELAMLCGSVFQLVLSIMYALKKKKKVPAAATDGALLKIKRSLDL